MSIARCGWVRNVPYQIVHLNVLSCYALVLLSCDLGDRGAAILTGYVLYVMLRTRCVDKDSTMEMYMYYMLYSCRLIMALCHHNT